MNANDIIFKADLGQQAEVPIVHKPTRRPISVSTDFASCFAALNSPKPKKKHHEKSRDKRKSPKIQKKLKKRNFKASAPKKHEPALYVLEGNDPLTLLRKAGILKIVYNKLVKKCSTGVIVYPPYSKGSFDKIKQLTGDSRVFQYPLGASGVNKLLSASDSAIREFNSKTEFIAGFYDCANKGFVNSQYDILLGLNYVRDGLDAFHSELHTGESPPTYGTISRVMTVWQPKCVFYVDTNSNSRKNLDPKCIYSQSVTKTKLFVGDGDVDADNVRIAEYIVDYICRDAKLVIPNKLKVKPPPAFMDEPTSIQLADNE